MTNRNIASTCNKIFVKILLPNFTLYVPKYTNPSILKYSTSFSILIDPSNSFELLLDRILPYKNQYKIELFYIKSSMFLGNRSAHLRKIESLLLSIYYKINSNMIFLKQTFFVSHLKCTICFENSLF